MAHIFIAEYKPFNAAGENCLISDKFRHCFLCINFLFAIAMWCFIC